MSDRVPSARYEKPWLRWEHINLAGRFIRILAEISKTGKTRLLEHLPPRSGSRLASMVRVTSRPSPPASSASAPPTPRPLRRSYFLTTPAAPAARALDNSAATPPSSARSAPTALPPHLLLRPPATPRCRPLPPTSSAPPSKPTSSATRWQRRDAARGERR